MIDLVKYPVITEKSSRLIENQYTFDVDPRLTKPQIKKSLKIYFKSMLLQLIHYHQWKKRLGRQQGYKTRYKRVIITKPNQTIPIFGETSVNLKMEIKCYSFR
jgi:large subunit ribosomal protein L23